MNGTVERFVIFATALGLMPYVTQAQTDHLQMAMDQVALTDTDTTLAVDTLDLENAYGIALDGGGIITYHYRSDQLVLMQEEAFRTLAQFYFHHDTLIFIRDREAHFVFTEDGVGIKQTRLETRFLSEEYFWTLDQPLHVVREGVRVLSEGPCGHLEWEPVLERLIRMAPRRD